MDKIRIFKRAMGDVEKEIRKMEFPCMFPGCKGTAISSHSQQKEGALRIISQEGLVYGRRDNLFSMIKFIISGHDSLPLTKIGIREASAFDGYCSLHDNEIFSRIEREPIIEGDFEQAFLFFLRSFSHEIAAKRKGIIRMEKLRQKLHAYEIKMDNDFWDGWISGMKYFLIREAFFIFKELVNIMETKQYSRLNVTWRRINKRVPLSVSTSFCPWLEEYKRKWSPQIDKPQAIVSFTINPLESKTDIICSWLNYCHEDSKWIEREMASPDGSEKFLNLVVFSETEDFCVNIKFWDSLPNEVKSLIIYNTNHSAFRGPAKAIPVIVKIN